MTAKEAKKAAEQAIGEPTKQELDVIIEKIDKAASGGLFYLEVKTEEISHKLKLALKRLGYAVDQPMRFLYSADTLIIKWA